MRGLFKTGSIVGINAALISVMFLFLDFALGEMSNVVDEYKYHKQPVLTGTIEDKSINRTSSFLGAEHSHYHVIIDDKAYTTDREEWNKITEGDEVEYKENNSGEIIIQNVE